MTKGPSPSPALGSKAPYGNLQTLLTTRDSEAPYGDLQNLLTTRGSEAPYGDLQALLTARGSEARNSNLRTLSPLPAHHRLTPSPHGRNLLDLVVAHSVAAQVPDVCLPGVHVPTHCCSTVWHSHATSRNPRSSASPKRLSRPWVRALRRRTLGAYLALM